MPAGALFTDTPTNLSNMASPTEVTIISDTGTNTTLVGATAGQAGLMTNVDKSKLDAIEVSADVTDTANVYTALGINQDTGDINRVLTQSGAYVAVNERILQVSSLAARPREFNVITTIFQFRPGDAVDSLISSDIGNEFYSGIPFNVLLEEFIRESVPFENLETFTLTEVATNTVVDLIPTGTTPSRFGQFSQAFGVENISVIGFNWESPSQELTDYRQYLLDNLSNTQYRLNLRYTVPSPTGAYAAVSNPMYFENDAVVEGGVNTGVLRARECVELFNSASTVWNPSVGTTSGTLFGVTNQDLAVNLASDDFLFATEGFASISGTVPSNIVTSGDFDSSMLGSYFYFEGFDRAGVLRLSLTDIFGDGSLGNYRLNWQGINADEFTNGQQEIIPSGTNLRYVATSADLTEVSFDASIGLIAEPDLVQIHAPTVRMLDIPTDTDPSPILVLDEHSRVRQLDAANLDFSNLPTSDPGITGRLWNDSGTLRIST